MGVPIHTAFLNCVFDLTYEPLAQELLCLCGPILRFLSLSPQPGCPYAAQVYPSLLPMGSIFNHQAVSAYHFTYHSTEFVTQLGACTVQLNFQQ